MNTSRQFGGSLGLAVLATVASQSGAGRAGASALVEGFHNAFLVGAGFAFAGAVVAGAALARRRVRSPSLPERHA